MPIVDLILPHHRYAIHIDRGVLARAGELLRHVAPHGRAALFCDAAVADSHASVLRKSLQSVGYQVTMGTLPPGEVNKTLDTVRGLYDALLNDRLERSSPVIALGGGVTGDTVGFVASTYLRGVPFIQCPTTLLAMVDASVGGKVGVNVPQGKNLVGSFYQPRLVVIDTDTLATLPAREFRCGLAECVKHGIIRDAALFDWIEANLASLRRLDADALVELVRWNVAIKARVVMADEKESAGGERAHLNFGHTFAHAIEVTSGYGASGGYHHGEAVALGMVAATRLAVDSGFCTAEVLTRLTRLLTEIGLPTAAADLAPTPGLLEAMKLDKKVAGGALRLVLPQRLGMVSVVKDAPLAAVAAAWEAIRKS